MPREESVEEIWSEQIKCAEILYRTIDAQLQDFQKILQKLSSALSRYPGYAPQPARGILDYTEPASKNNDDQPRGPDGQWISVDASDSPSKAEMDIDVAVAYLDDRADDDPPGKGLCATYVRAAIEKGGKVILKSHPEYAYQYALPRKEGELPYLDNYFENITPTKLADYSPQKGDIAVFQPPPGQKPPKGHIQMYNGTQWVSDFKQPRRFWPGEDYEKNKPAYAIYRPKNWKPKPTNA